MTTLQDIKTSTKTITKVVTEKRIYLIANSGDRIESRPNWDNVEFGTNRDTYYTDLEKFYSAVKLILKKQ